MMKGLNVNNVTNLKSMGQCDVHSKSYNIYIHDFYSRITIYNKSFHSESVKPKYSAPYFS